MISIVGILIMALLAFACGSNAWAAPAENDPGPNLLEQAMERFDPNAYQRYQAARYRAMNSLVKANMHRLQLAVECYAEAHGGRFPTQIDTAVASYFPGGGSEGKRPGKPLENPVTKKLEWPIHGSINDVQSARLGPLTPLAPGKIEYSSIGDGHSYAIRGGAPDGKTVVGPSGHPLVLSSDLPNQ